MNQNLPVSRAVQSQPTLSGGRDPGGAPVEEADASMFARMSPPTQSGTHPAIQLQYF
jgi:hypothetical protein